MKQANRGGRLFGKLPTLDLTGQFLLYLVAISVIPLMVVGISSYLVAQQTIRDEVKNYTDAFMTQQVDYLELRMQEVESLIANVSTLDEIENVLDQEPLARGDYTALVAQARMGYILSGYTHLKGLVSIDIFTESGIHYHVGDTLNTDEINLVVKNQIYQSALSSERSVFWSGVGDNVNKNSKNDKVISAAKVLRVLNPDTLESTPRGLLLVNLSVESFSDHFANVDLGDGAFLTLFDGQNRLVSHSDPRRIGERVDPSFLRSLAGGKGAFTATVDGAGYLITYERSPFSGWLLVGFTPEARVSRIESRITVSTLVSIAFCLLLILLIGSHVTKSVVYPINQISERFQELRSGSLDTALRLEEKRKDEIGQLNKWFNAYLDSLREKQQAVDALRQAKVDLEQRVKDRTAELERANQVLQQELVERARIEKTLRLYSSRLEILHEIDQQVLALLPIQTIVRRTVQRVCSLIPSGSVFLLTLDNDARQACVVRSLANDPSAVMEQAYPLEDLGDVSSVIAVLQRGDPCILTDRASISAFQSVFQFPAEKRPEGGILLAPLKYQENLFGVLSFQTDDRNAFSSDEIDFALEVAHFLAVAIQQAALREALQQHTEQLESSLQEKVVLLKEIHHRVKNNLQVISSLLSLQSSKINDPSVINVLRDSQNRVRSMALIHEKLYRSDNFANVNFGSYVHSLVHALTASYNTASDKIRVKLAVTDVSLGIDIAIPCGLILNELITNALKYAFPNQNRGEIIICLEDIGNGQVLLSVSDNGIGFPEGYNGCQAQSLGLQLVASLVEQIDGCLTVRGEQGASFEIVFPQKAH